MKKAADSISFNKFFFYFGDLWSLNCCPYVKSDNTAMGNIICFRIFFLDSLAIILPKIVKASLVVFVISGKLRESFLTRRRYALISLSLLALYYTILYLEPILLISGCCFFLTILVLALDRNKSSLEACHFAGNCHFSGLALFELENYNPRSPKSPTITHRRGFPPTKFCDSSSYSRS